jgi:hypothetical protein
MKVADAPITLLADDARCEITVLAAGVRIIMTSEEAGALWTELGVALKKIYADPAKRCPSKLPDVLDREPAVVEERSNGGRHAPAERMLEGIIAYAHRSSVSPDGEATPASETRPLDDESQGPRSSSGMLSRAIGKLTGR